MANIKHLYVHVPFCDGKCAYCALYSVPYARDTAEAYLAALERELAEAHPQRGGADTLYVGGGTPTVLAPDLLRRLCGLLQSLAAPGAEWSMEAAPNTMTRQTAERLTHAGVNRVSLGVQSMIPEALRRMGRRHTVGDVETAVLNLRAAGITNIGLDLIAGYPGVSAAAWRTTLAHVAALAPEHVSVYMLALEEGSRLGGRPPARVPSDRASLRMLHEAADRLGAVGYERYEVSNFARPGRECRHNLATWLGGDFLGFGPGASSRAGRRRWTNLPDVQRYIREPKSPREQERVDAAVDAAERILFSFRLNRTVRLEDIAGLTKSAPGLCKRIRPALGRLATNADILLDDDGWRPVPGGLDRADQVAARFLEELDAADTP